MQAHRIILDYLSKNDEGNLATLVNACQEQKKREPADVLQDVLAAIAELSERSELEVWLVDPRQPLRRPEKVQTQHLRDRIDTEARALSWDDKRHRWTSVSGPHGQEPYLWFALKTA